MTEPTLVLGSDKLSIKQIFNAPISRLFDCFTQPNLLAQWHAPGDMKTPVAEVDLTIGGSFKIVMQNAEGESFTASGHYREIEAPTKLVYTWGWAHTQGPETLVTVLLTDLGEQTEVELIHSGFAQADVAEHHSQGWTGIFINLARFLA